MPLYSQVSYHWQTPESKQSYRTGVSLHSHTSYSVETLSFIHVICTGVPMVRMLVELYDRRSRRLRNMALDFNRGNWRPPLRPRMAFDLEHNQIQALGLEPLVSITDHDDIQAPLLLRTIPSARHIPVSLEWTCPYGPTAFHLGIHNLPSAEAAGWMTRFEQFTAAPGDDTLHDMLAELNEIQQVLIVLNHPQWDLHRIGAANHARELQRFLESNNVLVHAFELNGLRHARENREVMQLAEHWNQLLISGGDRHGLEPNANINLTDVSSFTEFVREIRVCRRSHVLFLDQYARSWEQRILESTLDAVSDHAHFSPGWQRWDERAFHPDKDGTMRPLSELWSYGRAPFPLRMSIHIIRLARHRAFGRMLGMAFSRGNNSEISADTVRKVA